jgi:DNA-binding NarL/FixJ family response regulator
VTALAEHARAVGEAPPSDWASAVAAWELAGQPYWQAYAERRHAEALINAGDRERARSILHDAHVRTAALGAGLLHGDVVALARRARLDTTQPTSDRDRPADPYDLTPRERQVLAMLTEGRTNREIATELFVSHRTVGSHVSNLLGKLGARTRSEAAAIAHRERLL